MRPIVDAMAKLTEPGNVTQFDMDLNVADLYPNKAKAECGRYLGSVFCLDSVGMFRAEVTFGVRVK